MELKKHLEEGSTADSAEKRKFFDITEQRLTEGQ